MSKNINFGNVADDYANYRDEIPDILFAQLKERQVDFAGKQVVDLGAGTGIFTRAIATQGAIVTGVEPEAILIEKAKEKDQDQGQGQDQTQLYPIRYVQSKAEQLNLLADNYDIVTAVRAWHWFDRETVIDQVKGILKTSGYLIVIHSIFVPQQSEVAQLSLKAVQKVIGELRSAGSIGEVSERRMGLPVNWFEEWETAGLRIVDEWQYDYSLEFSVEAWCGKVRSLSWLTNRSEETKQRVINEIKQSLRNAREPLSIPHRYSVVLLQKC